MRTLYARYVRAVCAVCARWVHHEYVQQLLARCKNVMDDVRTLWDVVLTLLGRCKDVVSTLLLANLVLKAY